MNTENMNVNEVIEEVEIVEEGEVVKTGFKSKVASVAKKHGKKILGGIGIAVGLVAAYALGARSGEDEAIETNYFELVEGESEVSDEAE